MNPELEHACWRGLHIGHPPDWEMVAASVPGRAAECGFADRRHERMKLAWQGHSLRARSQKGSDHVWPPSSLVATARQLWPVFSRMFNISLPSESSTTWHSVV